MRQPAMAQDRSPTSAATSPIGSFQSPLEEGLDNTTSSEVVRPNDYTFRAHSVHSFAASSQRRTHLTHTGTVTHHTTTEVSSITEQSRQMRATTSGRGHAGTHTQGFPNFTDSNITTSSRGMTTANTETTSEDDGSSMMPRSTPRLLAGSKFDKHCYLKENRWIKVGRGAKAQLLLKNSGVSRTHCTLMWDPRDKVVILNHVSLGGVILVNGESVKGRRNISHGDKIRVQGKGITYDFILDARPAGIASSDPKHMQSENKKRRQMRREFEQRRDGLREQISQVDKAVISCETRSFDKEKEFYEIMARRRVRFKETQTKEGQIKEFNSEIEQLRVKLSLSRDEWLQRLQDTMDNQAKEIEPLTTATNDVQCMLEKLQQKKIELERELHPEKFEIQKVDILDEVSELTDRPGSASHAATPIADADVEGEEEATFGKPLSLEDGPKRAPDAALEQPEAKSLRVS